MTAPVLKNRAGVTTTTAGTGTVTLGSALGAVAINAASWQDLATSGVTNGQVVRYLILDSNGAWEYGTGTYASAGPTLSRTLGGSSTGSLLVLSGSAQVFVAAVAEDIVPFDVATGTIAIPTLTYFITINGVAKADYGNTVANGWAFSSNMRSTGYCWAQGGMLIGAPGVQVLSSVDSEFQWANAAASISAFISLTANATWQHGRLDSAVPVAQTVAAQSVVAGTTDTAGADFTLQGSRSTGAANGGDLVFKTSPAGASGTSQNAAVEVGRTGFMPTQLVQTANSIVMPPTSGIVVPEYYEIAAGMTLELGAGAIMEITG